MSAVTRERPLKYHKIADELRRKVSVMPSGTRLPSERELADRFDCNVLTVRKSLSSLVDEGRIERRVGSGTFVLDNQIDDGVDPVPMQVTGQLGLLAYTKTNAYGQHVLQALTRVAGQADIALRTAWVDEFGETALAEAERLAEDGCEALVLPWFPHALSHEVGEFVRNCGLPVSLPMLIPGLESYCFERPDLFGQSMLTCTDALCKFFNRLGHRRIALLGPDTPADAILQARLSAYSCAMSRLGREHLCGLIGPHAADADALAARWADYRGELAIIAYDDTHAMRFMTAMHKLGLEAPFDFVIVGFNNSEAAPFCDPPLSSLDQDFDYIGRALLRSAQALARGEVEQSAQPPPHRLLVRASCGSLDQMNAEFAAELRTNGLVLANSAGDQLFD